MQFNSYDYVFLFLPAIIVLYFIAGKINRKAGKIVLILGSLFFYGYNDMTTMIIMALSLGINQMFVRLMDESDYQKRFFVAPVVINVGLLLYFKYTNFFFTNISMLFGRESHLKSIILPVGISFFTFQQIAYVVAYYKKEIKEYNAIDYFAYILYFPKILMGPLMDPVDFVEQFNDDEKKKINFENFSYGIKIFSYGLLKKVLLADTFAIAVNWAFENFEAASVADWLLVILFYTFEIYFDFSGYSDMAVGSSLMLNITLPINFDSPYKSSSIRGFWKGWHVSLTKFLTKYIFIPLGGSRKGMAFTCLNTMIVFLISGIWHGANWTFILWGIFHGLFSVLDRFIDKKPIKLLKPLRAVATFVIVNILWLLFRADTVGQWFYVLKKIVTEPLGTISNGLLEKFDMAELHLLLDQVRNYQAIPVDNYIATMIILIVIAIFICLIPKNNYTRLKKLSPFNMIFAAICFAWGITFLGGESVFVYFNF